MENNFVKQSNTDYYNLKYNVKIHIEKELPLQKTDKELCLEYGEASSWCINNTNRMVVIKNFERDFNSRPLWDKIPTYYDNFQAVCDGNQGRGFWGLDSEIERGYIVVFIYVDDVKLYQTYFFFSDYGRIVMSLPDFEYDREIYYIDTSSLDYKISSIFRHDNGDKITNHLKEIIVHPCYSPLIKRRNDISFFDRGFKEYMERELMKISKGDYEDFSEIELEDINCKDKKFKTHEKCQNI